MQSFTNYAIHNTGGFHQEFILDSDDDPPETNNKIIQKIQKKEDSLSSIDPLSVSVGIPSSPSSISSNEGPNLGGLTPVAITPDHSNQNSPGPSSPDSAHGQSLLNSDLHQELKFNDDNIAQKEDNNSSSSPHHPSLPGERMPILGKSLSWVSNKLSARTTKTGCGLFCAERIKKGEYLVVWTGRIVSADEALSVMSTNEKHYILQIGEGFYQTPLQNEREAADLSNHSCEPTAGFGANSPICLTAVRDLEIGEEVVFDYGMCETDERLWEPMECACGSKYCRGLITANDWKREDLWERYEGLWAPHVKKLVDQAKQEKQQNLLKEQRSLVTETLDDINNNQSMINDEDIALPPKSSNALINNDTNHDKPSTAPVSDNNNDNNNSIYYKAAPIPSHWLGKIIFPIVDILLAKVGLARVSV